MNKGFYIMKVNIGDDIYRYYIVIKNSYIHSSVRDIAEMLEIPPLDYVNLLISYGAEEARIGCLFKHFKDAYNCTKYLNNTYLLMLRLANKV